MIDIHFTTANNTTWSLMVMLYSQHISSSFPGSFENLYDFTAPFSDQLNESWDITEDSILSVTSSFVGFIRVNEYKITALTDTSMWLTYGHMMHHYSGISGLSLKVLLPTVPKTN